MSPPVKLKVKSGKLKVDDDDSVHDGQENRTPQSRGDFY
jgi:hypothetical protein